MKKVLLSLLILVSVFFATGCGKEKPAEGTGDNVDNKKEVLTSKYITIDGLYIDQSKKEEGKDVVYVFYTLNTGDKNFKIDSKSIGLKINGVNEYTATVNSKYVPRFTDYYYSDFLEEIYVGETYKICTTFEIPSGDLTGGKKIEITSSTYDGVKKLKLTTDTIKTKEEFNQIAEDLNTELYQAQYTAEQDKLATVDTNTINKVRKSINGYYYSFYTTIGTSIQSAKLEFSKPNKFKITNAGLSNSGTYDVRKNYIVLKFPNGNETNIEYEFKNGDLEIVSDLSAMYSTYVDYSPVEREK